MRGIVYLVVFVLGALWRILTFLRSLVATVLLLAVVAVLAVWFSRSSGPVIPDGKFWLEVPLEGTLSESARGPSLPQPLRGLADAGGGRIVLSDLTEALSRAKDDPRVAGVVLTGEGSLKAGPASLAAVGEALEAVRAAGKPVFAWAADWSQAQYLAAVHASELHVHPMGRIQLSGLSGTRLYWGALLEELGVSVHVFQAGDFKSYPEVFVRSEPSEESRAADRRWMNDEWVQIASDVEKARKLPEGTVARWLEELPERLEKTGGDAAKAASDAGLIDGALAEDEAQDRLRELAGGTLPRADWRLYLVSGQEDEAAGAPQGRIARVTVEGEITQEGGPGQAGADQLVPLLDAVRKDAQVRALVLRINSPGGDALASESIRRAAERVREAGKPVVVSMGDMAASGGYWISLAADTAIADPRTVTGSIGVFGIVPTFEKTLKLAHVGAGGEKTAWTAGQPGASTGLDPRMERIFGLQVGRTYRDFLEKTAKARNLPLESVRGAAQGRVHTGRQAKALGLVTALGGLEDARREAARQAGLPETASWKVFEPEDDGWKSWRRWLARRVLENADPEIAALVGLAEPLRAAAPLLAAQGRPQAHCLCRPGL